MSSLVRGFISLCVYYLNACPICVVYMRFKSEVQDWTQSPKIVPLLKKCKEIH
jgi:hypothetical protein